MDRTPDVCRGSNERATPAARTVALSASTGTGRQLRHKIEYVRRGDVDDPDRVAWLRRSHPFTLRETDEFTRALRAAATERGMGRRRDAVEGGSPRVGRYTRRGLRAAREIARRLWLDEVKGGGGDSGAARLLTGKILRATRNRRLPILLLALDVRVAS